MGASIFIVPSTVVRQTPFLVGVFVVWVLGSLFAFAGVLTIAELAAMLPQAGGAYVYIRHAFGPMAGFLFNWTDTLLVRGGAIATIGFTFGIYTSQLFSPASMQREIWQGALAIGLILVLMLLNILGVRWAASLQLLGTVVTVAALAGAIILPAVILHRVPPVASIPMWVVNTPFRAVLGGIGAALVPVLWTYGGWEQLAYLSEEVEQPERVLPRMLFLGMCVVTLLYLGVVLSIQRTLPFDLIARSEAVGASLFNATFGTAGIVLITVLIMISTIGAANAAILSAPRSFFALARDGLAPAILARTHPRFKTPVSAIVVIGTWAIILIAGSLWAAHVTGIHRPLFETLLSYVAFGYLLFQALAAASAIVLRVKRPELHRPFRSPLFPLLPLISICSTVFLIAIITRSTPAEATIGAMIVLSGIPAWFVFKNRSFRSVTP